MRVTIIADASYCPDTGVAGYGFWIASARGKRGGDGTIKRKPTNSSAAEIMALLNGMYVASKTNILCRYDNVLLQTDCQAAIDALRGVRVSITEQEKELVRWFNTFVARYGLATQIRHVKGHSALEGARYTTNRMCDRKARKNMRKARDKAKIRPIHGL